MDVDFAVQCDLYIKNTIQEIHNDKIKASATVQANKKNTEWIETRTEATATRKNLTDEIKLFCEYAELQRGDKYPKQCPYYIQLTNLVYKVLHIEKPKGNQKLRDVYDGSVVEAIECLEDMLCVLLKSNTEQEIEYHDAFKAIKGKLSDEAIKLKSEIDVMAVSQAPEKDRAN